MAYANRNWFNLERCAIDLTDDADEGFPFFLFSLSFLFLFLALFLSFLLFYILFFLP
jgi:hypothetical protein